MKSASIFASLPSYAKWREISRRGWSDGDLFCGLMSFYGPRKEVHGYLERSSLSPLCSVWHRPGSEARHGSNFVMIFLGIRLK